MLRQSNKRVGDGADAINRVRIVKCITCFRLESEYRGKIQNRKKSAEKMANLYSPAFFVQNFVNGRKIVDDGTHVEGFLAALQEYFFGDLTILLAGLTAIVSIWYTAPSFDGATMRRLNNPEVQKAVREAVLKAVDKHSDNVSPGAVFDQINEGVHEKRYAGRLSANRSSKQQGS